MNTDKPTINWQNFARVRLELKFAFITGPLCLYKTSQTKRHVYNNISPSLN